MRNLLFKSVGTLIALFLIVSLTQSIIAYRSKVQFYSDVQAEYEKELDRNKKLKSDLRKQEDYYFVERQIREELNLLQEDEISIIIPELTPTPTPTPAIIMKPYKQWIELLLHSQK